MKHKTINLFVAIATILQTILLSIDQFKIEPSIHVWIMVFLTFGILLFNTLANWKSNTMVVVNIVALIGFFAGGIIDKIDLIPSLSEVAKANILAGATLAVTLSNIFKKALTQFLPIEKTE
jgi:ABC-type multidrug transport system permease subunit